MTEKEIYEIVNSWDLSEAVKKTKIEILEEWKGKVSEEEKNILFKICSNISYYSEKLTCKSLVDIEKRVLEDTDYPNTLFFSIKKKERMESSAGILFTYACYSNLRASYPQNIIDIDTTFFIKNFIKDLNDINEYLNAYKDLKEEMQGDILSLEEINIKNKMDEIEKKLREIQSRRGFNIFKINRLVLVDDFIGSGKSIKSIIDSIVPILKSLTKDKQLVLNVFVLECQNKVKNEVLDYFKNKNLINVTMDIYCAHEAIDFINDVDIYNDDEIRIYKDVINKLMRKYNLTNNPFTKNMGVASFVNAPNNNLPLISKESASWNPIFKRDVVPKVNDHKAVKELLLNIEGNI